MKPNNNRNNNKEEKTNPSQNAAQPTSSPQAQAQAAVQWFPGHMAKTRRQIKENLPLVDAVVELRDARVPESSHNPELNALLGQKPQVILLNKCDLADEAATAHWLSQLRGEGVCALAVDCRSGKGLNRFAPTVQDLLQELLQRRAEKGMKGKPIRLMVVGIPNTGKSSLINRLAGNIRAQTADKPGVTRQNRWYPIRSGVPMELLDTPGVLWPKFEDPAVGDRLAFLGAVKDEIMDVEALATRLLALLAAGYAPRLVERFKLEETPEALAALPPWQLLDAIARKRGMLLPGDEADTFRAAVILLDELRGGKLGRITLD
ncbi:MAG: ribosome biogenesis GTPase YlqF [Oscillospiraceae bacterium]|jgi:ribosome biogenesis GTPase A|nr:ribosome biogenesis GTPase YlqF [Oscillospiraceae bacterium]